MVGRVEWGTENNPESVGETETTDGVSTSAVTVYTADSGTVGSRVLLMGVNTSDSTITFVDTVLYASDGVATQVGSASRGSPDGRTYSVNGDQLQVTMAANTYDVTARALEQLPG